MIKVSEVLSALTQTLNDDVNLYICPDTCGHDQVIYRSMIHSGVMIRIDLRGAIDHPVMVIDSQGEHFRFMITDEGAIGQSNSYKRGADMVLSRLMIETVMMVSIELKQAVRACGADPEAAYHRLTGK